MASTSGNAGHSFAKLPAGSGPNNTCHMHPGMPCAELELIGADDGILVDTGAPRVERAIWTITCMLNGSLTALNPSSLILRTTVT